MRALPALYFNFMLRPLIKRVNETRAQLTNLRFFLGP